MSTIPQQPSQESTTVQHITRTMTIGDVVARYSSLAEVLLDHGIHCIGCGAAYYETLEQGFKSHGIDDATINTIIKEMNEYIASEGLEAHNDKPLSITPTAAQHLKTILKEKHKEGWGLRVCVTPGGCAGFSYGLDFEETPEEEDIIIEQQGVRLFIDPESNQLISGATIDYVDALQGGGFKIRNPHAKKTCGCGQSFS